MKVNAIVRKLLILSMGGPHSKPPKSKGGPQKLSNTSLCVRVFVPIQRLVLAKIGQLVFTTKWGPQSKPGRKTLATT